MSALVSVLEGNTFVVSDEQGDIEDRPDELTGLFSFDTRFLSKWILTLDGTRMKALSVDDLHHYEARFYLVPGPQSRYEDARLSVTRHRQVANGFQETVTLANHSSDTAVLTLRLDIDADFADIFEVKEGLPQQGTCQRVASEGMLRLYYQRGSFSRATSVVSSTPADADERGLAFPVNIPPHGEWSSTFEVTALLEASNVSASLDPAPVIRPSMNRAKELEAWIRAAPTLITDDEALLSTYRRSLFDLAGLRFATRADPNHLMPAAGLPWFMAVFGRDAIFTSLQTLAFTPELAATTLRALGQSQGSRRDDFRDEDPGRILHEQRFGELTAFEERPQSPYYGSADATPLYVVLLDEYERWTGDTDLVKALEYEARAALRWIDDFADLQGNGYVSYRRRNEDTGLENQCWKCSWDSVSYRDGALPNFPRATCELQGYAYDAKRRGARLARSVWHDPKLAESLERQARDLKVRFNRDFWVEEEGYFALALDSDGRQVDALASNQGHLLWSGIVDDDKTPSVVQHLMSDRLYSGWGVRTLATSEARYNPVGYHVGTVWPFDNSIIAWGLRLCGYRDEAARIAEGMLDAATYFDGRLPEAFAGFSRNSTLFPVPYPTACAPQAWSTGAPLLLLRVILGLEPLDGHLVVDPFVPASISQVALLGIPGRWGSVDAFARGRIPV